MLPESKEYKETIEQIDFLQKRKRQLIGELNDIGEKDAARAEIVAHELHWVCAKIVELDNKLPGRNSASGPSTASERDALDLTRHR
jgi:hypothetical protein